MVLNLRRVNMLEDVLWLIKCKRQVFLCEGCVRDLLNFPIARNRLDNSIRTMND